jgi:glyoxylase-like metal-dependent hydrolase (beta-lactamase superfamily II)
MISIKTFVFNSFQVNAYVLYDETGEAALVDAACSNRREEEALTGFLDLNRLKPVIHLNTHCHVDHVLGNDFVQRKYGLLPVCHQAGSPFIDRAKNIAATFGYHVAHVPHPATFLSGNDDIGWGSSALKTLYTPGHADGSVCFYSEAAKFVITGDVLFRDSIGRTDLPSGDFDLLMESIREKLFTLPDSTVVYPGHGPETTIGYEKRNNPFIR